MKPFVVVETMLPRDARVHRLFVGGELVAVDEPWIEARGKRIESALRARLREELSGLLGEVIKTLQSVESDACAMGEFIQADCVNVATGKVRSIDIDAFMNREEADNGRH